MIQVENLTRRYGSIRAVEDVSFEVGRGEVVGFLGPNGAGKTTTMRVLCGCIGATSGRALVAGLDVLEKPLEVKRHIGYLPEIPPVYGTMTVRDYVAFAAQIKGVSDPVGAAKLAMGRVGLDGVAARVIEHLSKGYRQRVGLASALVHNPDVLILDEPTSGLDPAQRKEIRELLAELAAGDRTVILSTHVLPEVEAICKRVVIINRGRIVAQDSIAALAASATATRVRVNRPDGGLLDALRALPGVSDVHVESDGHYLIRGADDVREAAARAAVPYGLIELGLAARLEDIYLRLTTGGDA